MDSGLNAPGGAQGGDMAIAISPPTDMHAQEFETGEDEQQFTEEELQMAKRFLEAVGGADRARELLDKVVSCEDCLGLISDEDEDEELDIQRISDAMPEDVSMPSRNPLVASFYPTMSSEPSRGGH